MILRSRTVVFSFIILLHFFIWFAAGYFHSTDPSSSAGERYDKLSDSSYNLTAINDDVGINPHTPYFVGFDTIRDYGVSLIEYRYLRDAMINTVLYKLHSPNSKISYIKGSYTQGASNTLDRTYSYKFAVDESKYYQTFVTSNIVNKKLDITIKNTSGDTLLQRSFIVIEP